MKAYEAVYANGERKTFKLVSELSAMDKARRLTKKNGQLRSLYPTIKGSDMKKF